MSGIDWVIVACYLAFMVFLGWRLSGDQESAKDFFTGGGKLPWWALGISTMATQTSALSLISIPAFVVLREGGGLTCLQFELAIPLAMLAVMVAILPALKKIQVVSAYEFLGERYSSRVQKGVSAAFLLSRGLSSGVSLFASSVVLSVVLEIPIVASIVIIGVITLIYDLLGGMASVVLSDVIQMVVLIGGVVLCIYYATVAAGGVSGWVDWLSAERAAVIGSGHGFGDGAEVPFWAYLFGGFFLYVSYYGTDQTQIQRQLSAATIEDARRSLLFNGFFRSPIRLLYVVLGLALGGYYASSPEFQSAMSGRSASELVPVFLIETLPTGVRGLFVAALAAATMSTIDSNLNSLAASTTRDFGPTDLGPEETLKMARWATAGWGMVVIGAATALAMMGDSNETLVETINKVGSAFYGPILGVFLAAIFIPRSTSTSVAIGGVVAFSLNIFYYLAVPSLMWMWWNLLGTITVLIIAFALGRPSERKGFAWWPELLKYPISNGALVIYFLAFLVTAWLVS